jgi:hypothetical protein
MATLARRSRRKEMANVKSMSTRELGSLKRTIRATVLQDLADKHAEEFDELMAAAYGDAGLVYTRPLTAEEKAEAKRAADLEKARASYAELITRFPELEAVTAPVVAVDEDEDEDLAAAITPIDSDVLAARRSG